MFVFMSYCFSILKNCVHRREKNNEQNTKKIEPSYHHFPPFLFFNKRFAKKQLKKKSSDF